MHPILKVNELLLKIFGALSNKADLLRCCLTCKQFHDVAVWFLWEDVSVSQLLSQFPEDAFVFDPKVGSCLDVSAIPSISRLALARSYFKFPAVPKYR